MKYCGDDSPSVGIDELLLQLDSPNYQLKALKKVFLEPGESAEVSCELDAESFGLYDEDGNKILNRGKYEIYVGTSQPDTRSIALTGKKPVCLTVYYDDDNAVIG